MSRGVFECLHGIFNCRDSELGSPLRRYKILMKLNTRLFRGPSYIALKPAIENSPASVLCVCV